MQDDGRLVEAIARAMFECAVDDRPWANADKYEYNGISLREFYLAKALVTLSAIEREGWKVVPVEPTDDMLDFSIHVNGENVPDSAMRIIWAEMVAAAPKQG